MDKSTRIEKLAELKSDEKNIATKGIPFRYKGQVINENAYKIPLDYLVYNKYNGRIGSSVLSYERQNGEIDVESEQGKKLIEKFLYDSRSDRNKTTMDDLREIGQQRFGIVTSDGIIIDGNRRAMLLNKLFNERDQRGDSYDKVQHCQYFVAVILPDEAQERDIQQLETIYQMGEDDKLDYNPIEKYLKCKELIRCGFTEEDIAGFMNEKPSQIKKWLRTLNLMEEYLETYEYDGIYTRLEKTEGQFVDLDNYLDAYQKKGAVVNNVNWDYSDSDIADLKLVCFDYIRARYEGKDFREIAKTGKDGSLFFYEDIWKSFLENHSQNIPQDEESVDDIRREHPGEDLSLILRSRDDEWAKKATGPLKGNLQRHTSRLDDMRTANKPAELLEKALNALQAVDYEQDAFYEDESIKTMVKEINTIIWDMKKALDRR